MFVNRTSDITNYLNTMYNLIECKENRLTEWVVQRQQHEAENEKRLPPRETNREERGAATNARKVAESKNVNTNVL